MPIHTCHPFKAYDIRGRSPQEVTPALARQIGEAFALLTDAAVIVLGRDMRTTSADLHQAFADGVRSRGTSVLDLGLVSTDVLYFASGTLNLPAAMITASHNPAGDNGIKLSGPSVAPIDAEHGLEDIHHYVHTGTLPARPSHPASPYPGAHFPLDIRAAYTHYLRRLVNLDVRPLTVVVDAGNGMGGTALTPLLAGTPINLVPLHFTPDGTFPHHDANPMDPANLHQLSAAVREHGADLGIAFDGDADRCFAVDETGTAVTPDALLALFAERLLAQFPGSAVVHDLLTSHATIETITEAAGVPHRARVGHSFIKSAMSRHGAILGGETSGHYYFRDFWHADSGPLAALHLLAAVGQQPTPVSELLAHYTRYASSGEVNIPSPDPVGAVATVRRHFPDQADDLDGLSVRIGLGHWFNLRASNVDPVVRLTVEAPTQPAMHALRSRVLDLIPRPF